MKKYKITLLDQNSMQETNQSCTGYMWQMPTEGLPFYLYNVNDSDHVKSFSSGTVTEVGYSAVTEEYYIKTNNALYKLIQIS